jgi:hypothetical protein
MDKHPNGTSAREGDRRAMAADVSGSPTAAVGTRQARLHQAFAHLYPGIPGGVWLAAAPLMDQVWALRLERGMTPAELRDRALDPVHFEFRYGETTAGSGRMGRASDRR